MGIRIFLDDERVPKVEDFSFIVRCWTDWCILLNWCKKNRIKISYISFDHDLGEGNSGYDCCKLLVEMDIENQLLSKDFSYNIHSGNIIGGNNIKWYLKNCLLMKNL